MGNRVIGGAVWPANVRGGAVGVGAGEPAWRRALVVLARWRERERHRFVLVMPVLMIVGIAGYLSLRTEPPIWAGLSVAGSALVGWIAGERFGREPLRLLGRAVFFAGLGFALVQLRAHAVAAPVIGQETPPVTVEGVLERVETRGSGLRYTVRTDRIGGFLPADTPHRVRVNWRGRATSAAPGDRVRLRAVLSPPPGPILPGGYDYARRLWFERIGGVGYSYTGARVTVGADGLSLGVRTERLREAVADRVQAGAGARVGGLAAALVTGKRERVPEPIVDTLRDTGLAHLLAISGLHMGLVTMFLFGGVRFGLAWWERAALSWNIKKIAAGVALVGGAGYLVLSGAPISAQRAFVMAAVTFGAILFDRQAISLRNVALAATLVLLLRPEAAAGAGFQMSFMAVTVLVAAYSWWEGRRRLANERDRLRAPRPVRFLGGLFATSLLAGLATGPFAAYHFGRIAVWGLPANMVVMPLVTLLVMPTAVIGLALAPLGLDAPAWWVMGRGLEAVVGMAGWFEALPGAVRRVAQPPATAWVLTIAGMLALCLSNAPWRLAGALALPAAAWLSSVHQPPDVFIGRDARQVAVRVETEEGSRLALLSRRRDRFAAGVWLETLGLEPDLTDQPKFGECGTAACSVTTRNAAVLTVATTPEAAALACRRADIVIYGGWTPQSLDRCAARLFTAAGVARSGPLALKAGVPRGVGEVRGCRPWTRCGRLPG